MKLYGCKLLRVAALNPDGTRMVTPTWVRASTPQEAGLTPQYKEGAKTELRGGDSILAIISKKDKLTGLDFTFRNARLDGAIIVVLAGGTYVGTKYTAPTSTQSQTVPPFEAELYVANYVGNANAQLQGYVKFHLPYCKGRLPSLPAGDRQFGVPSFTIKARENSALVLPCYEWELVDALPA